MKSTIYYSVANHGDGSAYPQFFEDALCAETHQELMEEGWGESCDGSLSVESDGPVKFLDITTRAEYIEELKEELEDEHRGWRKETLKEAIESLEK